MKMFQRIIPRLFLWLIALYAVLLIGTIGCGSDDVGEEDNEWVGIWSLATFDGQTLEKVLDQELGREGITISIVTNAWTFNNDGTLEAEISFKLGTQGEDSGIAITSSNKTTGTYSLSGSQYTLTATTEGEAAGFFGDIGGTDEDTGTWTREGNTLTLNSDDGEVIVFKKK